MASWSDGLCSHFHHIFFLFFFLKTNINDTRLNELLRWIYFFLLPPPPPLQCGGELISEPPVFWRRTNRLLHGPVNHRLGNQQGPSDRKDAWCFKPSRACAPLRAAPSLLPPSSVCVSSRRSGLKPLLRDTGHHARNKNEVRRLENWTCCQAAMAVLGDLGTAGRTRLGSFILGNVNTVIAGLVMWRRGNVCGGYW